jgi:uncharacterized RDD family membrane protein YckC
MLVAGQSLSAKGERPVSTKVAKPGGFLPRTIALIIDSAIIALVTLPLYQLWVAQLTPQTSANVTAEAAQRVLSFRVALAVVWLFYFAGSWAMVGGTPGQRLLSLRVTDANAAGIGFFRAVLRAFWFALFGVLSVILVPISKQKRALHDILAGTYVIQVVDRDDLQAESALPAAFAGVRGGGGKAPTPAPASAPVAAPPSEPIPVATAYPSSPAPEAAASVAGSAGEPDAIDLPPLDPIPAEAPGQADEGRYTPPPLDLLPPPSAEEGAAPRTTDTREVYSPTPGKFSDRAAKSAGLYVPEPSAPPAAVPSTPEPAPGGAVTEPPGEGELPPIEFPPMAPPPSGS